MTVAAVSLPVCLLSGQAEMTQQFRGPELSADDVGN